MSLAPASFSAGPQPESNDAGNSVPWLWASLGGGIFVLCAGSGAAVARRLSRDK
jgi:hypothetical protein